MTFSRILVRNVLEAAGLNVYPETETRVTVLSVSDGFLIMTRFRTRIVLLPRYRILLAHLNLYYLCTLYHIKICLLYTSDAADE